MGLSANTGDVRLTRVAMSDGGTVAIRRWSKPGRERMVVSHGNGLAVEGFRSFGQALEGRFEVIAFDMRGHGDSGPTPLLDEPWPRYIADIPEIFDAIQNTFGEKPTHGAFHSLSSISTLMSQGLNARNWRSLTLYEPPIPPTPKPELLHVYLTMHEVMCARTRNRRRQFDSADRLAASFARSPTFAGIPQETLGRLAKGALQPATAGSFELVCNPEMEARTYEMRGARDWWSIMNDVDTPVQIVVGGKAAHDMPVLIDGGKLVASTFGWDCEQLDGGNHLMQLQHPAESAALAARFAAQHSG